MGHDDFRSNEKSVVLPSDDTLSIVHVGSDGQETVLKEGLKVLEGEVVDATFMSAAHLDEFLEQQVAKAKADGVLFSAHLKATMMKVSDPIIFGHVVRAYFADVFAQYGEQLAAAGLSAVLHLVEARQEGAEAVVGRMPAAAAARRTARRASGRRRCTTWPKMIGSETFIIVALRCTENSTSSALARATCSARKRRSAATLMKVPSTTSPARTCIALLEHRLGAVGGRRARCAGCRRTSRTTDFSLERKSSSPMVATLVLESPLQAPMRCGWAFA